MKIKFKQKKKEAILDLRRKMWNLTHKRYISTYIDLSVFNKLDYQNFMIFTC